MLAHPYFNKQKFNSEKPKNFMMENDGYRRPFSSISNHALINPGENSLKNYTQLPVIQENKILQNNTSVALKIEGKIYIFSIYLIFRI